MTSTLAEACEGKLRPAHRNQLNNNINGVDKYCVALELTQSAKQVARCAIDFKSPDCTYENVVQSIVALQHRIGDELGDRLFLRIHSEKANFFDKAKDEFGKTIVGGFPS